MLQYVLEFLNQVLMWCWMMFLWKMLQSKLKYTNFMLFSNTMEIHKKGEKRFLALIKNKPIILSQMQLK